MEENQNNFLIPPKNKKKIKLFSNAFPPQSISEAKKIQPIYSDIHKFLHNEKHTITQESIKFRTIEKKDLLQLKPLFKEWFPITYDEKFYDNIFLNQEITSGLSLVAYIDNPNKNKSKENLNIDLIDSPFSSLDEIIIGAIITNYDSLEYYIHRIPYEYENLSYLDEISLNGKYFVYVQSLGVIDECRRLKLGTILLNNLIDKHIIDYNCLGIYLHVVDYNNTALRFYEKNEFVEMNHLYNYYLIDQNFYDSKVMVRLFYKKDRPGINIIIQVLELLILNPLKIILLVLTCFLFFKRCRHIKKLRKKNMN